jgi:hypothetical protein
MESSLSVSVTLTFSQGLSVMVDVFQYQENLLSPYFGISLVGLIAKEDECTCS